jgi:hypothetical protein
MARTVGQVVEAARAVLQDEMQPYRYSTVQLCGYVSEAVGEARRLRPDMFHRTFRNTIPFYTANQVNEPLPISDMYFAQVVNYTVGRAELREDQFASDNRAMSLLAAFGVSLVGGAR